MQLDITEIERYLHETLELSVRIIPWQKAEQLPHYLRQQYRFYTMRPMEHPVLLMIDQQDKAALPAQISKHIGSLGAAWEGDVVYVNARIAPYNRKRLVLQKVPFIVPGNQLYLPAMGIDFREHFKKIREKPDALSPAGQLTVLFELLRNEKEPLIIKKMAASMGYSSMTMKRVFDELESLNLARGERKNRERIICFPDEKMELWQKALPFLTSPVKQTLHLSKDTQATHAIVDAGLTALARYSKIAAPKNPVAATGRGVDGRLQKKGRDEMTGQPQPGTIELQVWSYNPVLLSKTGMADRLSLYLSLKNETDERVEAALEEMLKGIPWFTV